MEKILVPDLGGFENIEIIEMFVSEGDSVKKETSLFSLESDKAVMDIPSPYEGIIKKLFVTAGDKVSKGVTIGEIETSDMVGEGTKTEITKNISSDKKEVKIAPLLPVQPNPEENKTLPEIASNTRSSMSESLRSSEEVFHASPSVRQYARDLEIDLLNIIGTGPKGRISKEDLRLFIKKGLNGNAVGTSVSGIPAIPYEDYSVFGSTTELELSRIKKLTGEHLSASWLNIPHVTQFDEADISSLESFRKEQKMSILSFIVKASFVSLQKFPYFNSSLGPTGKSLILKKYFNIGIAVDTEKGLVVPVIKDVDKKSVSKIADELKEKSDLARQGRLKPEDFKGGSFTISSLGGISGTGFTPIVNAPQAAILGVSRSAMKPVWNGSEFKPRLMLPFSLSYDHRIIDGAEAARFTKYLSELLEDIRRILL